MADRDGEGVGGIGRLGRLVEGQQAGDHELDLLFGSEAVADDGALDGEWSVFDDGQTAAGGGKHSDATDLAEFEGGLGVGGEEDLFNGDDGGLVQGDEAEELGVDLRQTLRVSCPSC